MKKTGGQKFHLTVPRLAPGGEGENFCLHFKIKSKKLHRTPPEIWICVWPMQYLFNTVFIVAVIWRQRQQRLKKEVFKKYFFITGINKWLPIKKRFTYSFLPILDILKFVLTAFYGLPKKLKIFKKSIHHF